VIAHALSFFERFMKTSIVLLNFRALDAAETCLEN
jgi:hypothetical protein